MTNVSEIVENGLCSGCGACSRICPLGGVISMKHNDAGFLCAEVAEQRCVKCGKCLAVCPGNEENVVVGDEVEPYLLGHVRKGYVGWALDAEVRENGQSGGIVTALLLFLMESGRIDGAIVSRFQKDGSKPVAVLAGTREEILSAQGSFYCQTDTVRAYLENAEKRLAVVTLGCQARAIRNVEKTEGLSHAPIKLGLFCGGQFSKFMMDELIHRAKASERGHQVLDFRFRDKKEDGNVTVTTNQGKRVVLREERLRQFEIWKCHRCNLCPDFYNTECDIVCGDPWGIEHPEKEKGGISVLLARTERGEELIRAALKAGAIRVEEREPEEIWRGQQMMERIKKVILQRSARHRFRLPFRYVGNRCGKMEQSLESELEYSLELHCAKGARVKKLARRKARECDRKRMVASWKRRVKRMLKM